MSRKVIVSAGHSTTTDPGAVFGNYKEATLAAEFRTLLVKELKSIGVNALTDPDSNALIQTLTWIKGKFGVNDILLDIHWNAASPTARGTEVIVPKVPSKFELEFSKKILNIFVAAGFTSRGVKTEDKTARKTLGWMRPVAENILIEMCFITNKDDMELYEANKVTLAKNLAHLIKINI